MAKFILNFHGRKHWYSVEFQFKKSSDTKLVLKFSSSDNPKVQAFEVENTHICVAANDSQEALAKAKVKFREENPEITEDVIWGKIKIINTDEKYDD